MRTFRRSRAGETVCRSAGCRSFLAFLVGLVAFLGCVLPALAEVTEYRDFSIYVDGKEAGSSKMTLVQGDDGADLHEGDPRSQISPAYQRLHAENRHPGMVEDGRLIGMETESIENGKKTKSIVAITNNQLRIRVNGQDRALKQEIWPSSFWKLADGRFHNKQIPVLEVDTGKDFLWRSQIPGPQAAQDRQ